MTDLAAPRRPLLPGLRIGGPRAVIPGPGLPPDAVVDTANNNLDAVDHDGVLYLAWRTAPTHFASRRARIQVLASRDGGVTWALEYSVRAGRDLREPRLLSWQGRLLLYWFTAGTSARAFEPDRIWVTERMGPSAWRRPVAISPPDCVVWRVRPVGDRLAMTVYRGASRLFGPDPVPLTVELWGSDDGWSWGPFDPSHPVVHRGGAEAEILQLPDGRLLSVVRKEGPEGGWGSDVAVAPADDPTHWVLRPDPRKLDSPWLFLDRGRPFLIARRSLAPGGRYDVLGALEDRTDTEVGVDPRLRTRLDQAVHWLTPKRTTVHVVDPDDLRVHAIGDLPSAGDTAFAATVPLPDGGHRCFNYTSPPERAMRPWIVGQLRPTAITAVDLHLTH